MRNLLALLGAAVVTFVCLGWYLDWFKISRQPSPQGGTQRFQLDVERDKIAKDVEHGVDAASSLLDRKPSNPTPAPETNDKPPQPPQPPANPGQPNRLP